MVEMKILLVDDEEIVRDKFSNRIPWEENGFHFTGSAGNGLQALEMIPVHVPHILLLDITMPVMGGLELAAIVRKKWPNIAIIFLTAHNEFDYVKNALQLGVKDYLVKATLTTEQVLGCCKKIAGEVSNSIKESESQQKQFTESKMIINRVLMQKAMEGYPPNSRLNWEKIVNNLTFTNMNIGVLWIGWDVYSLLKRGELAEENLTTIQSELINLKIGCGNADIEVYRFPYRFTRALVLLCLPAHMGQTRANNIFHELLWDIKKNFETKLYGAKCFAYMDAVSNTIDLFEKVKKGLSHLSAYFYLEKDVIDTYDSVLFQDVTSIEYHDLVLHLNRLFQNNARTDIENKIRSLTMETFPPVPPGLLIKLAKDMFLNLFPLKHTEVIKLMNDLDYLETKTDYAAWWSEGITKLNEIGLLYNNSVYHPEIRKICKYISLHYDQDIQLARLAEKVGLNAAYTGQLFKQQTGQLFADYVNNVRVSRAQIFLKDPEVKIYEVSNMVGIADPRYFCRLFKKVAGLTPTEFRERV